MPSTLSASTSIAPVSVSSRCTGPGPPSLSSPPTFAMMIRPSRSMLIPFGEPPAFPTRFSEPSASASAAALA